MTIFPIAFAIVLSFEKVNVTANGFQLQGATLSNYHTVVTAGLWHHALWFTSYYTVISVIVEVALGTMFALVLERLTHLRGPMMAILLIPWSLITVISAELWGYIYNATYGVLDDLSHIFGTGEPVVLGTPLAATVALIFADVWKTTPFVTIIVLAGLVMIPQELVRGVRGGRRLGLEDVLDDHSSVVAADTGHRRVVPDPAGIRDLRPPVRPYGRRAR